MIQGSAGGGHCNVIALLDAAELAEPAVETGELRSPGEAFQRFQDLPRWEKEGTEKVREELWKRGKRGEIKSEALTVLLARVF